MTDESAPKTTRSRAPKPEVIEDAVIVEDSAETPIEVETAHADDTEPVVATTEPAAVSTPATEDQASRVVYVHVPPAPRKAGNRAFGVLIAVLATVVFTALVAVATVIIGLVRTGAISFAFLGRAEFYIPTLFFAIGFVLLALLANRANWWAYILGSILVGLVVYFGSVGLVLLGGGIIADTPDEASLRFAAALRDPFVIVAALLAREVSMWTGTAISRRGRQLTARNAEARAAYDRELAEKTAAGATGV